MRSIFTVTEGPDKGHTFRLRSNKVMVGRDADCELRLRDMQVSRCHAKIIWSGDACEILDNQSRNGILVNGEQISRKLLNDGDMIVIGNTMLYYHVTGSSIGSSTGTVSLGTRNRDTQTISMDSAQVFKQWADQDDMEGLQRARSDLEALYRVGYAINSILETYHLIPKILEMIFYEMDIVERGSVHVLEGDRAHLICKASKRRTELRGEDEVVLSTTMSEQVLVEKKGILTYDAMKDFRFSAGESVQLHSIRSAICVPIMSQEELYGIIYTDTISPRRRFTRDDLRLLTAIGLQAGTAMENAQLYERLAYDKAALHVAHQQLKSTQDKLIQSEKLAAVGRLASGFVHDIKNPLTVILGYTGIIREKMQSGHPKIYGELGMEEFVGEIEKSIHFCNDVTEQLIKFARPSKMTKTRMEVKSLVNDTLAFLQYETNKAQVKVETRLSDDVPGVMADGSQIKQVLINVIINAVQAMESTGEKVLKVYVDTVMKNEGQFVVIGFHDSGEGMTDEELKQIFEPFYTTKTPGAGLGGTGLGLSVSYSIIDGHGGAIECESEKGKGTIFRILLPAVSDENDATKTGGEIKAFVQGKKDLSTRGRG